MLRGTRSYKINFRLLRFDPEPDLDNANVGKKKKKKKKKRRQCPFRILPVIFYNACMRSEPEKQS